MHYKIHESQFLYHFISRKCTFHIDMYVLHFMYVCMYVCMYVLYVCFILPKILSVCMYVCFIATSAVHVGNHSIQRLRILSEAIRRWIWRICIYKWIFLYAYVVNVCMYVCMCMYLLEIFRNFRSNLDEHRGKPAEVARIKRTSAPYSG